jgi:hypothetical protein
VFSKRRATPGHCRPAALGRFDPFATPSADDRYLAHCRRRAHRLCAVLETRGARSGPTPRNSARLNQYVWDNRPSMPASWPGKAGPSCCRGFRFDSGHHSDLIPASGRRVFLRRICRSRRGRMGSSVARCGGLLPHRALHSRADLGLQARSWFSSLFPMPF